MVSPAVATIILRITLLNYDAKHLAKTSSRYKAQPGARLSAVTLRSAWSTCPSFTSTVSFRMIEDSFNFMRAVRLCRIEKGNSTIKG
jgi:hypothetical protein